MAKGPRCTVCLHPEVRMIDAGMLAGHMSINRIAHRYELGVDSLYRHRDKGHINAEALDSQESTGKQTAPDFDDEVSTQTLRRELMRLFRSLFSDNLGPSVLIQRANAIRLLAHDIDEAEGPASSTVTDDNVCGYPEWRETILFQALERWPDARTAIMNATPADLFTNKERHEAYLAANRVKSKS
jgi:hypothetical protein